MLLLATFTFIGTLAALKSIRVRPVSQHTTVAALSGLAFVGGSMLGSMAGHLTGLVHFIIPVGYGISLAAGWGLLRLRDVDQSRATAGMIVGQTLTFSVIVMIEAV